MSQKFKISMKSTQGMQNTHPFDVNGLKASPSEFAKALTNDEIGKVLDYLSSRYYNGSALVEDQVFDALPDILMARDPSHPCLQKVGADITEQEQITSIVMDGPTITNLKHRIKAKLPYWMGSMDKIKPGNTGLGNWISKFPGSKVLSDKMDGTSALLVFKTLCGSLDVSLFTRGNGSYGQDISCLLPYLRLPMLRDSHLLPDSKNTRELAIRAELIMTKANFKRFEGKVPNARNLVSGIVNSKTIQTELIKLVDFVAYELIGSEMHQSDQFKTLQSWGYNVSPYVEKDQVNEDFLVAHYAERKKLSQYEIDGIIVTDDSVHPRNTSKNPKYAVAFKMITDEAEQVAETEVITVDWTVQKDGYLFPVIRVKPVFLSGTTIQNVSGKNAKFIVDNCIGAGSIVRVVRDGTVIPGIYEVVTPALSGDADLPDDDADDAYHWTPTGVDIVLDEIESNPKVQLKRIINFFEKMGVVGFAEGMITRCFQNPKLNTVTKILEASIEDFMELPGVQIRMGTKIYEAIQKATAKPDLYQIMVASNVFGRGFGVRKIKTLLAHEPNIMDWNTNSNFSREATDQLHSNFSGLANRIREIDGFDTKTAGQFASRLEKFKTYLQTLPPSLVAAIVYPKGSNKNPDIEISSQPQSKFAKQTVVFSGFRNKEWEKIIENEGGRVGSSVSGNTTIVVVKDLSFVSGKIAKAQSLGVTIMAMEEFRSYFEHM